MSLDDELPYIYIPETLMIHTKEYKGILVYRFLHVYITIKKKQNIAKRIYNIKEDI